MASSTATVAPSVATGTARAARLSDAAFSALSSTVGPGASPHPEPIIVASQMAAMGTDPLFRTTSADASRRYMLSSFANQVTVTNPSHHPPRAAARAGPPDA